MSYKIYKFMWNKIHPLDTLHPTPTSIVLESVKLGDLGQCQCVMNLATNGGTVGAV